MEALKVTQSNEETSHQRHLQAMKKEIKRGNIENTIILKKLDIACYKLKIY